jgi:hypothetical protein
LKCFSASSTVVKFLWKKLNILWRQAFTIKINSYNLVFWHNHDSINNNDQWQTLIVNIPWPRMGEHFSC